MNKEMIIKLLNECLSSNYKDVEKEMLLKLVSLLESIIVDVNKLKKLDVDKLKECCQIKEEEIQDLSFYMIMCQLEDVDYQLTDNQIKYIKELINKYLKELKEKLILINIDQEKNNFLRKIIEKISQDRFILSTEELVNINKFLKDKNVGIDKVNKIMISLSLGVIRELERQLKDNDEEKVDGIQQIVHEPVKIIPQNINGSVIVQSSNLSKDEFYDKLWDLLNIYGCGTFSQNFVNKYTDEMMKETNIDNVEDVLKTLNELGIRLTLDNFNKNGMRIKELLCYSSGEIIKNVLKITTKLSGNNNQWCFDYLFPHIAIFIKNGKNSAYQDFIKNMCMFEELKISSEQFMMINEEILCINHLRLKKNMMILEKYKIPREKYLSSITILKTPLNFSNELDTWIELGNDDTESYLNNRLSILVNNHISNFGIKLRILRDLGINITIKDRGINLNRWLFEQIDLMDDKNVVCFGNNRYEVNFVPYKVQNEEYDCLMSEKRIERLEDKASKCAIYQKFVNSVMCVNDLYYYILGVNIRVSKNKVYRVFNKLINSGVPEGREMLIYAITYNSVINEEEYINVCKFVDNILGNSLEYKGSVR